MKIAYIHPRDYPSQEVNALQALQMASAFSSMADTSFFFPRLSGSLKKLKGAYGLPKTPLKLCPMPFRYVPDRVLLKISDYFERSVAFYLRVHPAWRFYKGQKVLFVRDSKELLFWGQQKEKQPYFQDWTFVFEAHSTIGMVPGDPADRMPFKAENNHQKTYQADVLQALQGFDRVICLTQALADALHTWTCGAVKPQVVRHASPIPHKPDPPQVSFGETITLGYIGQISQYKGVHLIIEALRLLPPQVKLRLVGRFQQEADIDPNWLNVHLTDPKLAGRVEIVPTVPITDVAVEIDHCDILIQPASRDALNTRFEAPLKSMDYMLRGKPIMVADVPCHHELYQDGVNGLFYQLTPQALVNAVNKLKQNHQLAERIARGAWAQSINYDYPQRAKTIHAIIKQDGN